MRGAVWIAPRLRAEISYAEIVDGKLRAPSWRGSCGFDVTRLAEQALRG